MFGFQLRTETKPRPCALSNPNKKQVSNKPTGATRAKSESEEGLAAGPAILSMAQTVDESLQGLFGLFVGFSQFSNFDIGAPLRNSYFLNSSLHFLNTSLCLRQNSHPLLKNLCGRVQALVHLIHADLCPVHADLCPVHADLCPGLAFQDELHRALDI